MTQVEDIRMVARGILYSLVHGSELDNWRSPDEIVRKSLDLAEVFVQECDRRYPERKEAKP